MKKEPKFLPAGKDYIDPYVLCDQIHIRNASMRAQFDALSHQQFKISYNDIIKYLTKAWFTSPKNVERVVNRNINPNQK